MRLYALLACSSVALGGLRIHGQPIDYEGIDQAVSTVSDVQPLT